MVADDVTGTGGYETADAESDAQFEQMQEPGFTQGVDAMFGTGGYETPEAVVAQSYCAVCDHDDHVCPGCGDGISHGQGACSACSASSEAIDRDTVLALLARVTQVEVERNALREIVDQIRPHLDTCPQSWGPHEDRCRCYGENLDAYREAYP